MLSVSQRIGAPGNKNNWKNSEIYLGNSPRCPSRSQRWKRPPAKACIRVDKLCPRVLPVFHRPPPLMKPCFQGTGYRSPVTRFSKSRSSVCSISLGGDGAGVRLSESASFHILKEEEAFEQIGAPVNKPKPKAIYHLMEETAIACFKNGVPRLGASLSYYTLFAIAPLFVIALAVAAFAFGQEAARHELFGQLSALVGKEGGQALEAVIAAANKPKAVHWPQPWRLSCYSSAPRAYLLNCNKPSISFGMSREGRSMVSGA